MSIAALLGIWAWGLCGYGLGWGWAWGEGVGAGGLELYNSKMQQSPEQVRVTLTEIARVRSGFGICIYIPYIYLLNFHKLYIYTDVHAYIHLCI